MGVVVLGGNSRAFRRACAWFCWVPAQGISEVVVIFLCIVVFIFIFFIIIKRVFVASGACVARVSRLRVMVHLFACTGHAAVGGDANAAAVVTLGVCVVQKVRVGVSAPRAHCCRLLGNGGKGASTSSKTRLTVVVTFASSSFFFFRALRRCLCAVWVRVVVFFVVLPFDASLCVCLVFRFPFATFFLRWVASRRVWDCGGGRGGGPRGGGSAKK
mmetsp:Transcript_24304/g.40810  ORF Transcript_24304/g.40810 Transcript_24304/m.40810 type:complete len:215 (-) Transcript_24304:37-681(-)